MGRAARSKKKRKEKVMMKQPVSAVLNGKRTINARQAKALAVRFKVPPAVFL